MHLVVDAQALQAESVRRRGIGRYTQELVRALAVVRPDWRVEAVVNSALPSPDPDVFGPAVAARTFDPPLAIAPSTRDANERFFGDWLSAIGPDVVIEPNVFEGDGLVPQFTPPRPLLAVVAYDLIPILFHDRYLAGVHRRSSYAHRLRRFLEADLVLAISESTRADVLDLLGCPADRVVTVLGGADSSFVAPAASGQAKPAMARLGIDRPFVLCIGGADPRKNLAGALAAFAALPDEARRRHLIVVVCDLPDTARRELEDAATGLGIRDQLRLAGFVADADLRTLYGACRLLLFPSHYEGLGLPVLEALLAGAPVVASNRSSVPEFAGPVSRLADPVSAREMADAMRETLAEPREAGIGERRTFASSFTWAATAERAASALERRVDEPGRPGRKARVAWVSPLPPTRSGISDYSADLVARLPSDIDVDMVVSPEATRTGALSRRFRVLRAVEALERHQREPFDLFVYHVGNSDLHVYMLDMMRRQSGLVVLHDVYLGGLALRAREVGAWPGNLPDDVEAEGGGELAGALRRGEGDHAGVADTVGLCRNLLDGSDAVVVHSAWSWRLVRSLTRSPVFRIPMGVASVRHEEPPAARARLSLPLDAFLVATLGEVTPAKQVDRLIRACAALPERIRRRLQLLVVGEVSPAVAADLEAVAQGAGVRDRLRMVGRVPMDDLTGFGRAADACVQLRYPARGETSAALLRALAAGCACIVSRGGSFGEVPPGAALHVADAGGDAELAAALVRLHDEAGLRESLRIAGARFAADSHGVGAAARAYAAAIRLTIARRARRDGDWVDRAAAALADVDAGVGFDESVIERWAQVRLAARNRLRFSEAR